MHLVKLILLEFQGRIFLNFLNVMYRISDLNEDAQGRNQVVDIQFNIFRTLIPPPNMLQFEF